MKSRQSAVSYRRIHAVAPLAVGAVLLIHPLGVRFGEAQPAPAATSAPVKSSPADEDMAALAQGPGLRGTMHGVDRRLGTYVFTWWHPKGFFRNVNVSLFPATPEVGTQLAQLERHQALVVRGALLPAGATQQPHVRVEAVEPGEKWDPGVAVEPRPERRQDLAAHLAGKKQVEALVHAVSEDGSTLVVEYRDEVIPVQVPDGTRLRKQVADLYRGDRVRLRFRIAEQPARPLHLRLTPDPDGERPPLVVTDSIHAQHDQERTLEGRLVLFPKSPVLRRTIWGLEERGPDGLHRYFTVFNFQDLKDQERIDQLLQTAWSSESRGVEDGRNKYIHRRVRIRVTGKVSNPAHNQANPTIVTEAVRVEVIAPKPRDER